MKDRLPNLNGLKKGKNFPLLVNFFQHRPSQFMKLRQQSPISRFFGYSKPAFPQEPDPDR
jgi:hypothetical protein